MRPSGGILRLLKLICWLEGVEFAEALLLFVLARGFVALVERGLGVFAVRVGSLTGGLRLVGYVVDCVGGCRGLFCGRQGR